MSGNTPRKFERIQVRIPALVSLPNQARRLPAEIRNLSEGGAMISSQADLLPGQHIVVEFAFKSELRIGGLVKERVLTTEGVTLPPVAEPSIVRWAKDQSSGIFGVQFTDTNEDSRAALRQVIDYFMSLTKAGVTFE